MFLKKLNAWLHLWLGLASGIIVFIVALTGAILVFEHDFKELTQSWLHAKRPENGEFLPPSVIREKISQQFPDKKIYSVWYYGHNRTAKVNMDSDSLVYVNPYTAQVAAIVDEHDFFHFILDGHTVLWIENEVGEAIVSYGSLTFFVLLITGLILWWPKKWNKANKDKSFKIKWKAKFKRVNYDLHNVLGFYALLVALLITATGLTMCFSWFNNGVYWLSSGGEAPPARLPKSFSDTIQNPALSAVSNVDKAWKLGTTEIGVYNKDAIIVSFPQKASDPIGLCTDMDRGSWRYVNLDQHTLKELPSTQTQIDFLGTADWIRRTNYALHVGAIGNFPTKILYFIACLICASLPITGFYVWWGKRKTTYKPKRQLNKLPKTVRPTLS